MNNLQLTFTANIAESYKRLSYTLWYALAEYVDNSTQAYYNNKERLKKQLEIEGEAFFITIDYCRGESTKDDYFEINDNSFGMDEKVLTRAFNTGQRPNNRLGRSKYGLGLKTASFWLGNNWSVCTTMLGVDKEYTINVDIKNISGGSIDLIINEKKVDSSTHYTNIKIWNLHRRFVGRTLGKVRTYLSSIFRYDLMSEEVDIKWMNDFLKWEKIEDLLIEKIDGSKTKLNFEFSTDGKQVRGWAGVMNKGNRGKAGFSLIQSNRVINPNYRPSLIFGDQDGGRNDLINQRLVGEIFIDGFDVSHTKDQILWTGEQEEELEKKLKNKVSDLIRIALTRRVRQAVATSDIKDIEIAIDSLHNELESEVAVDLLNNIEIPPAKALNKTNMFLLEAVVNRHEDPVAINVGSLTVKLYSDEDMSSFDPYVISDSVEKKENKNEVIIVFNPNHPHWQEIKDNNGALVFIRHIVYDGVAEWKAWNKTGKINHDTVKFIKDNLLRIPFEIDKTKSENEIRDF